MIMLSILLYILVGGSVWYTNEKGPIPDRYFTTVKYPNTLFFHL